MAATPREYPLASVSGSQPRASPVTALVFGDQEHSRLAGRTLRSARAAGAVARDVTGAGPIELAEVLESIGGPLWLLRAGCWGNARGALTFPQASATGTALSALGWPVAALAATGRLAPGHGGNGAPDVAHWRDLYASSGGDLAAAMAARVPLPALCSALVEPTIVRGLIPRMRSGTPLQLALVEELHTGRYRVVRHSPLDVDYSDSLRVVQVITSLQRGGAERLTLDLARTLFERGTHCRIVTLGRPTREPFPVPPGTCDLSRIGRDRADRIARTGRLAVADGCDMLHAHLLDGEDLVRLSALDIPTLVTVHNSRPGWQAGQAKLRTGDADLIVACAMAVEDELRDAGLAIPLRTAWNGIDAGALVGRIAADPTLRRSLRERHGFGDEDVVLLSLANPRPQKRLSRLPAIAAAVRDQLLREGTSRPVRLVIAGEASPHPAAQQVLAETNVEIDRHGLRKSTVWLGAVQDVAGVLAAADVLVCASAFEGLSLAHLEAAASDVPVVATDVGGTREMAVDRLPVRLLSVDAPPAEFAAQVISTLRTSREPAVELRNFTSERMAERYDWLYPRVVAAADRRRHPRSAREGLWLVTNNFSTGGAQSSARRLLTALHARGVPVRATVLQEEPDDPTPGRQALAAAGIRVESLPPPGRVDTAEAAGQLLALIDADLPQAVIFWNVIPEYKVLLADGLLDVPVFDVSPGEMYHDSLARYFACPRPGLPYRTPRDYGRRLAGAIVKYRGERERAESTLGCPVHVIPNGVPIPRGPARGSNNGRLVIGTAARISPQKRLEDLLEAVARAHPRLPPYVLRIAGGPETGAENYSARLREQSGGLPVEWLGETPNVGDFLDGLDLFTQISEPAGCPNASLEALAAGLPIVATDVGGACEQIADQKTGRLVPPRDAAALAEALIELTADASLRSRLAAAGRDHAATRFSLDRMVDDYCRLCLEET